MLPAACRQRAMVWLQLLQCAIMLASCWHHIARLCVGKSSSSTMCEATFPKHAISLVHCKHAATSMYTCATVCHPGLRLVCTLM